MCGTRLLRLSDDRWLSHSLCGEAWISDKAAALAFLSLSEVWAISEFWRLT